MNRNRTFPMRSAPVLCRPFQFHALSQVSRLEQGLGVNGSFLLSGNVLLARGWAEGESDIFLCLSPGSCRGHLAGLLLGTRDSGGSETFRPGLHSPPRGTWARVTALGYLWPAREFRHSAHATLAGKPREAAGSRWVSSSQAPRPLRPKRQGRAEAAGVEEASAGLAREPPLGRD